MHRDLREANRMLVLLFSVIAVVIDPIICLPRGDALYWRLSNVVAGRFEHGCTRLFSLGDQPTERADDPTPPGAGTVVAHVSGVFGHTGGRLYSERTGVSLVIPEGAIPEGVQQEVYFKVCQDDSMLPPLDRCRGS